MDCPLCQQPWLKLYFAQLHLIFSFQNALCGNVTSSVSTQPLHPQQTRHLVVHQLVFIHQQPRGPKQHSITPKGSETRTKRLPVLGEDSGWKQNDKQWFVFFLLACFGHSTVVLPGYINKNTPIYYAAEKNRPLCLTVKLLCWNLQTTIVMLMWTATVHQSNLWSCPPLTYCCANRQKLGKLQHNTDLVILNGLVQLA